jgi:hypothetical protein
MCSDRAIKPPESTAAEQIMLVGRLSARRAFTIRPRAVAATGTGCRLRNPPPASGCVKVLEALAESPPPWIGRVRRGYYGCRSSPSVDPAIAAATADTARTASLPEPPQNAPASG